MCPGLSRAGQGKAHLHEAQCNTVPWLPSLAYPGLKLWGSYGAFLKAREGSGQAAPSQKEKAEISIDEKNTPQGRRLTTWRGRSILPGNVARAVPPHTMSGWVSNVLSRGHRQREHV